ncbi:MAG: DUF4386 family protein [Ekhidna sp.]|nr:DUF4386 family protein [Ekhidna sp.]
MNHNKLQKIGGISAILEGLIYIFTFVIYGGVLAFPKADASSIEKLNFLSNNFITLSAINLVSYVMFGILLAVLVLAIHQRLKNDAPILTSLASLFGVIWVGLVISSGMIANIGLKTVVDLGTNSPEDAMLIWRSVGIVSEGLGGGNEIVGGIWVLLLSIVAFKSKSFSKPLNILGLVVGIAGVVTIFPLEIFTEIFGLSQIIWFMWMGVAMMRKTF